MAKNTDDTAKPDRVQLNRNIAGLGDEGDVVETHRGQAELLVDKGFATPVVDDDTAPAADEADDEGDAGAAKTATRSRTR